MRPLTRFVSVALLTVICTPLNAQEEIEEDDEGFRVDSKLMTPEEVAKSGGAVTRVDEDELQAQEYDDPNGQVSTIPSVNVRNEDGFGLRPNIGMRGASSDRSKKVALMEDGVLFAPAPYSAPAAYYFPMANRTIGLEVYKGPASIRFGPNTIGGALNWISRPIPYDLSGGFDLNFGSYFTGKAHGYVGGSNDWGGFLIEGIGRGSDGFKELDDGGSTGFDREEIVAKGRLNSDPSKNIFHQLDLKIGFSRERSNETYLGLTDTDFAENPFRRYIASGLDQMNWWRTQGQLQYRFEVGRNFAWTTTAYRHDFDRLWSRFNGFAGQDTKEILDDPTGTRGVLLEVMRGAQDSVGVANSPIIVDNDRRFVSQGVQTEATFEVSRDDYFNELRVGARIHHDSVDRLHTEKLHAVTDGRLEKTSDISNVVTNNFAQTLAVAAFLQDTFALSRFTFAPGIRLEIIRTMFEDTLTDTTSEETRVTALPGVGSHFAMTPELGLLAGVYRGFSPVAPGQPSDVKAETSTNYEAGLRYVDFDTDGLIEIIGFFNDYQNLSGQCSFAAGCNAADVDQQFNGGKANVKGFELVLANTFSSEIIDGAQVPIRLSYTYTLGEFDSSFQSKNPIYGDVVRDDALPYVPRHQGALQVGLIGDNAGFNLTTTIVGPMLEEAGRFDGKTPKTDPYGITDVLVKRRVFADVWLYGKAGNVFGQTAVAARRPFGARPLRPFAAQFGISGTLSATSD